MNDMSLNARFAQAFYAKLTPRERDVLYAVVMGKPNKIIASELGVSQRTVEAHRASLLRKLQVRNAVELSRYIVLRLHIPPELAPSA